MSKHRLSSCILCFLLFLSVLLGNGSQVFAEGASASPTPAAQEEKAVAEAIPVNKIGEYIGTFALQTHDIDEVMANNKDEITVMEKLTEIKDGLKTFADEHIKLLQTNTPSDVWYARKASLDDYLKQVNALGDTLQKRAEELKRLSDDLAYRKKVWELTKASVKNAKLNKSVTDEIGEVIASLNKYQEQMRQRQSELLNLQNEVFGIRDTVTKLEKDLTEAIEQDRGKVFSRNSAFLWDRLSPSVCREAWQEWKASLQRQFYELRVFWGKNSVTLIVYLLIFAVVWFGLREVYRVISPWANHSGELQRAVRLVEVPIPIAALAAEACFVSHGVTLHIVKAIAGLIAVVPALVVLRRILDNYLTSILNAVLVVFIIDLVNQLAYEATAISRGIILIEALCIFVFVVYYLRSSAFASVIKIKGELYYKIGKIVGYAVLAGAGVAVLANVVGYVELARKQVIVLVFSTVSAFMLLAAAHFVLAMILFLVTVPPLSYSNLIQLHRADILRISKKLLYWLVLFILLNSICGMVGYASALPNLFSWIGNLHIAYGGVNVTIGQCLVALAILVISYQLSKLLLAISEYDILPRLQIEPNAANVLMFFARYVPYIVCFFIACAILGLSVENLAMVISALSVGIGFGLQNIINNFISGLILLFEPRIAVGGAVEFGNYSGILKNVGMRASVVRLFDGRELIVPNSELISNKVVSITNISSVPYRFGISFALIGPVDHQDVKQAVEKCALEHPNIASSPAPLLLIDDMDSGYPKYVLNSWVTSYELMYETKNSLSYQVVKCVQEHGWKLAGQKTEMVSLETLSQETNALTQETPDNDASVALADSAK